MIEVNKGLVKVKGRTDVLLAELSGLIFAFRAQHVATDKRIKDAIELGFLDKKEIHRQANKIVNKMTAEDLLDAIKDYFEVGENNNDI